jgi:hypothetical protein
MCRPSATSFRMRSSSASARRGPPARGMCAIVSERALRASAWWAGMVGRLHKVSRASPTWRRCEAATLDVPARRQTLRERLLRIV